MRTILQEFRPGQRVVVEPADNDDPLAIEWKDRRCTVTLHARGDFYNYVKVRDNAGHRATFRPADLRAV